MDKAGTRQDARMDLSRPFLWLKRKAKAMVVFVRTIARVISHSVGPVLRNTPNLFTRQTATDCDIDNRLGKTKEHQVLWVMISIPAGLLPVSCAHSSRVLTGQSGERIDKQHREGLRPGNRILD